jgi:hypothetical protein
MPAAGKWHMPAPRLPADRSVHDEGIKPRGSGRLYQQTTVTAATNVRGCFQDKVVNSMLKAVCTVRNKVIAKNVGTMRMHHNLAHQRRSKPSRHGDGDQLGEGGICDASDAFCKNVVAEEGSCQIASNPDIYLPEAEKTVLERYRKRIYELMPNDVPSQAKR